MHSWGGRLQTSTIAYRTNLRTLSYVRLDGIKSVKHDRRNGKLTAASASQSLCRYGAPPRDESNEMASSASASAYGARIHNMDHDGVAIP